MKCNLCNLKIERVEQKIRCSLCSLYIHAKCAKLEKADVEFFEKSKQGYKCESCTSLRRKSIVGDQRSFPFTVLPIKPSTSTGSSKGNASSPATCSTDSAVELGLIASSSAPSDSTPSAGHASESESSTPVTLPMLFSEIIKLQKLNSEALSKIKFLEERNETLTKKVVDLEYKVNVLEQQQLECCVDIVGLPYIASTNVKESVMKLVAEGIGENISENDIKSCYIKNKPEKKKNAVNIVCVKFSSFTTKQRIMAKMYANKVKLSANIFGMQSNNNISNNNKKGRIFINDSLTGFTRSLFRKANILKNSDKCKFVWIRNSTVLVRIKEGEKVLTIKNCDDLARI